MFEDYPDILSPEEAAEALRIGENAIYELLNEGKLKAYKNGRTWRVPKEAVKGICDCTFKNNTTVFVI